MDPSSPPCWTPEGSPTEVIARARAWLTAPRAQADRLVIATSGSTGAPKRVVLSRDAVLASVRASADRLGATGRWALALPPTYVAGLQVIVRSLVAGHDPAVLTPREDPDGYDGWPDDEGWFTSLVPTQLVRLLRSPTDTDALRRAHTVLLGGGPIDPALRTAAQEAGVRVVATYGAAETAGGCVYDGLPLDGVEVDLAADGRIRIGGPTLFSGYLDDPEQTATALVDGRYLTSDAGRIGADGRLQVLGRLDDVALSGGVNVPTPAVARRLREHPGLGLDIASVEVLGVDDPEWGQRVVAFLAPVDPRGARSPDGAGGEGWPSLGELRDFGAQQHPRSWAVRQVVVLDRMPLTANGKPDRMTLRRIARERAEDSHE